MQIICSQQSLSWSWQLSWGFFSFVFFLHWDSIGQEETKKTRDSGENGFLVRLTYTHNLSHSCWVRLGHQVTLIQESPRSGVYLMGLVFLPCLLVWRTSRCAVWVACIHGYTSSRKLNKHNIVLYLLCGCVRDSLHVSCNGGQPMCLSFLQLYLYSNEPHLVQVSGVSFFLQFLLFKLHVIWCCCSC